MTVESANSVVICGLPGSGKTTFLAALWYVVFEKRDANAQLKFDSLVGADHSHLNAIMRRWLHAKEQIHTEITSGKVVSMNLKNDAGSKIRMTLPDLSGESYQGMWEHRECDPNLADLLRSGNGILLFVNADKIKRPIGVAETTHQTSGFVPNAAGGIAAAAGAPSVDTVAAKSQEWRPEDAPTAVQLVDILQMFRGEALGTRARRLAVVLSAWDKVEEEEPNTTPEEYLVRELPLLDQYLRYGSDGWDIRMYGLSAQGGDFEREGKNDDPERNARVAAIRALDDVSSRIRLMKPELSNDLTEPIVWLTE
jgi:Double-GTPase 1